MNPKIKLKETLFYYDAPQIFLGETKFGVLYICELIDMKKDLEYFCVRITQEELQLLDQGFFSLRHIYLKHKSNAFKCIISNFDKFDNELIKVNEDEINDDWLPGSKSFLVDKPEYTVLANSYESEGVDLKKFLFYILMWKIFPKYSHARNFLPMFLTKTTEDNNFIIALTTSTYKVPRNNELTKNVYLNTLNKHSIKQAKLPKSSNRLETSIIDATPIKYSSKRFCIDPLIPYTNNQQGVS